MSKRLTLYPHLAAAVNLDCLCQEDQDLLARIAAHNRVMTKKRDENLQELFSPKVLQPSADSYQLEPVGGEYSKPAQKHILSNWRLAGASPYLLAILAAAQKQLIRRLIFEPNGMIPEKRKPAKIGKIGKRKIKSKEAIKLLQSLKLSHQLDWPIEQLANIVKPYARKTRRRKTR